MDLGLETRQPPPCRYHNTASRFLDSIWRAGLEARGWLYEHLSADVETATRVGQRHGQPVVLTVDAAAMHAAEHRFFIFKNGVWLTESVPARFLNDVYTQRAE